MLLRTYNCSKKLSINKKKTPSPSLCGCKMSSLTSLSPSLGFRSQHSSILALFMLLDFKSFHYIQCILSGVCFLFLLSILVILLFITVFFGLVFPNLLGILPGHGFGNSLSHPLRVVECTRHQGSCRTDGVCL